MKKSRFLILRCFQQNKNKKDWMSYNNKGVLRISNKMMDYLVFWILKNKIGKKYLKNNN